MKKLDYFRFNAQKGYFEYYCTNNDCWFLPNQLHKGEVELADKNAQHIGEMAKSSVRNRYYEGTNKAFSRENDLKKQERTFPPKETKTESNRKNSTEADFYKKLYEEQKRTNAFLEQF